MRTLLVSPRLTIFFSLCFIYVYSADTFQSKGFRLRTKEPNSEG